MLIQKITQSFKTKIRQTRLIKKLTSLKNPKKIKNKRRIELSEIATNKRVIFLFLELIKLPYKRKQAKIKIRIRTKTRAGTSLSSLAIAKIR